MKKQLLSLISLFGIMGITLLFTGIAWSRFSAEDKKIMHIDTYHQRRWYVFGQLEDETDISAEKIVTEAGSLPGVIQQANENKNVRFYVTNGPRKDRFNSTDLVYNIQVLVTNTLKPEEIDFVLGYTDTEGQHKAVTAIPVRITEDDPLYKSIGDGYVYKFMVERDVQVIQTENGQTGEGDSSTDTGTTATVKEEFTAVLPAGSLNYQAYDLQIVGQPQAGLMEIEIIEVSATR